MPPRSRSSSAVALAAVLGFASLLPAAAASGPGPHVILNIDWAAYLGNYDLVWDWSPANASSYIPVRWFQSAYAGNGVAGVSVKAAKLTSDNATVGSVLRFDVGHTEVWAGTNRQPIAFLALRCAGVVQRVRMRQILYTATIVVNITTTLGSMNVSIFTNAQDLTASLLGFRVDVAGAESPTWTYEPDLSGNSRVLAPTLSSHNASTVYAHTQFLETGTFTVAVANAARNGSGSGNVSLLPISTLVVNDSWWGPTQALRVAAAPPAVADRTSAADLFMMIVNTQRTAAPNGSEVQALTALQTSLATGMDSIFTLHTWWWADYWPLSFVSMGNDTLLESFYFIQMYRFASSSRTRMHDLMGPFGPGDINLCIGPWCQYCWDMNQQVMYYAAPASNRAHIWALPAFVMLNATFEETFFQQYGGNDVGWSTEALWMLRQMHRHILYTGNDSMLLSTMFPLLNVSIASACIGAVTNISTPDGGYVYRRYGCQSPEYPYPCGATSNDMNSTGLLQQCSDCNYQLAICSWAAQTAIAIADKYLPSEGAALAQWRDFLAHSPPFPVDGTGYKISRELPFANPHRHFSHLLMIYDLQTVGGAEAAPLMRVSLDNWWNLTCADQQAGGFNEQCRGFTQAGMSAMSAMLNDSMAARGNATALLASVISPNAQYGEDVYAGNPDQFAPVSESAYAVAGAVHEMLLASAPVPPTAQAGYNDTANGALHTLRLWAAAPWPNASIYNLRTEGSFVVSAQRLNGETVFASVAADASYTPMSHYGTPAPVVIWTPEWAAAQLQALNTYPPDIVAAPVAGQPGAFVLPLTRGGTNVIVYTAASLPPLIVSPASPSQSDAYNYYGYSWPFAPMH